MVLPKQEDTHFTVIKRDGTRELFQITKIQKYLEFMVNMQPVLTNVDIGKIILLLSRDLHDKISTSEIDEYTANICAQHSFYHFEYGTLASRIIIDNHHKNTLTSLVDKNKELYFRKINGVVSPLINNKYKKFVMKNKERIEGMIDYSRDYDLDFFAFRTLERAYLLKVDGKVVERPQDMFMRVAIAIHMEKEAWNSRDIFDSIQETYDLLSRKYFTHASPTLFNAGTGRQQLASCFLTSLEDSLEGIMDLAKNVAKISKSGGGIGIHVSNLRPAGSIIRSTGGESSGIVPFLKIFNDIAVAFNQGGKRLGSFAIYLEPHHPDFIEFLELRKPTGDEKQRARDLFLACWVSDLFIERVMTDGVWSMFNPDFCKDLENTWGEEYRKLYLEYEEKGMYEKQMPAVEVWKKIWEIQCEAGQPYLLYKDSVNYLSNQQNLGTIRSSNLCVSGDTLILTEHGYKNIKQLSEAKRPVYKIWNGTEFTEATFSKTGTGKKLIELEFSNGITVKCTPYHKFILTGERIVEAKDIVIGNDKLIKVNFPVINCYTKTLTNVSDNYFVPLEYDLESRLTWLSDLADVNGTLEKNEQFLSLQITFTNREFLRKVQLMCQTLGTNPSLERNRELFRLVFSSYDTYNLYDLGLKTYRLKYNFHKPNRNASQYITIVSKKQVEGFHDTFCFNESKQHRGIFNGIIAGNCAEIVLYSDSKQYSVCNLTSTCLSKFVKDKYTEQELAQENKRELNHEFPLNPYFDYKELADVIATQTRNLNHVIDYNWYPCKETKISNMKHRPIGIGVQGLADAFMKLRIPYDSESAKKVNKKIFETMYYAALSESTRLAREKYHYEKEPTPFCGAYETFENSPLCNGKFHWELWNELVESKNKMIDRIIEHENADQSKIKALENWRPKNIQVSRMWDWETLRSHIQHFGLRNSQVLALMPTASTSQIMGNNESFEPITSNLFKRKTLAGNFIVVNKYLMYDLINLGLWNDDVRYHIQQNSGSIQELECIPQEIRDLYKTAREISNKTLIEMSSDRQAFVDQSQSFNQYPNSDFTYGLFNNIQLLGWCKNLKTSSYYIRHKVDKSQQFSFDKNINERLKQLNVQNTLNYNSYQDESDDEDGCLLCGS